MPHDNRFFNICLIQSMQSCQTGYFCGLLQCFNCKQILSIIESDKIKEGDRDKYKQNSNNKIIAINTTALVHSNGIHCVKWGSSTSQTLDQNGEAI